MFQRRARRMERGSAARAAGQFGCGDGPGTGGAGPRRARAQLLMGGTWRCCIHKGLQRYLDPARCVPELRACSSGVFFASAAFGSFFISKVPVLSGMAQKAWPQHNIIAVVHFHFSPADRMAETRPYSNLGVEIKIWSEAGLINFFFLFPLSIFRPIISLKSQTSQLLPSSICRSCNHCSAAAGTPGCTSRSSLRAVPVFLPVPVGSSLLRTALWLHGQKEVTLSP